MTKAILLISAAIFALTVRGLPGNPTSIELNSPLWKNGGPFELSPERGRYSLLYSIVEDHSLQYSPSIARFATPDLGYDPANGSYVSLFAPGLSLVALPGYLVGRAFGVAQVGAFFTSSVFALINMWFIQAISQRLGATSRSAWAGSLAFVFATPAFAYATTLYQHHLFTTILLTSLYLVIRPATLFSTAMVAFLIGFSFLIDNPNPIFLIPIGLYALSRYAVRVFGYPDGIGLRLKPAAAVVFLAFLCPVLLFGLFNTLSVGQWSQLPGTLPAVAQLDDRDMPRRANGQDLVEFLKSEESLKSDEANEKTAVGFFETRNLATGLYTHFLSPDRGAAIYSPVILLGFVGLWHWYVRSRIFVAIGLSTVGLIVLLYSMWSDPWGGWAFGSRYLIPAYSLLAIGLAGLLSDFRRTGSFLATATFMVLFSYSVSVNTLGAITSIANPPKTQVLELEKMTGQQEKYTFDRNLDRLNSNQISSFSYRTAFSFLSGKWYHRVITAGIILLLCFVLWGGSYRGIVQRTG